LKTPFGQFLFALRFQWFQPISVNQHKIIDEYNPNLFGAFGFVNNHNATGNKNKSNCARWCFGVLMCEEMTAVPVLHDMPALPALHALPSANFSEGG